MIEKLKDLYYWHILGRCRKHNRELDIVQVFACLGGDTERFACIDCEPHMALAVLDKEIYG